MDLFDLRQWSGFIAAGGDPSQPILIDQIAIDSRRIDSSRSLFVPLEGKLYDGHSFISHAYQKGARYVLAKPEWKSSSPLPNLVVLRVDSPLRALQEIAGAYRKQFSCKVIGIAGSYGKTMVKDLLCSMLRTTHSVVASPGSFNSQIGVPLSLLTIRKEHQIALIEAATSQKGEMELLSDIVMPDCGIITHVGKRHLASFGSFDVTAREMLKLFSPLLEWKIFPKDPHIVSQVDTQSQNTSQTYFWNDHHSDLPYARFISDERNAAMSYRLDFPDGTSHFGKITSGFYYFLDLLNITAKAAWLLGVSSESISSALKAYTPIPMRTEIWKSPMGATFINDTYCSEPQSVDVSLNYLRQSPSDSRKIFAFGGMCGGDHQHRAADYKRIGLAIHNAKVDLLILYGIHDFTPLIDEIKALKTEIDISQCASFKDALGSIQARIRRNDSILIKGEQKHSLDHLTEVFNDSICSNQCIINLAAIEENLSTIRNRLPAQTRVMVIVKALAYGTDEVRIAKFLETCAVDILGVSYVDEGVVLKRAGASQAIFVINAAVYEAAKVVKWGLEIGVSDRSLIEAVAVEASRQNKKIKIHLHIDTGMGRFGCRPEEALELAKLILDCPFLVLEGIMTHFACADDPLQDEFTIHQANLFSSIVEDLKSHGIKSKWVHAANSSGAMRFHFPQFNMVRIGLAVYGLYASPTTKESLELRLALSLISRIVGINTCNQGETISYGRNYKVERDQQRIAVLPIGYFDGLHRNYSGKGSVVIRGQRAKMVGNICMDFMMVDVTDIPNAAPGDSVLVFGEDEYGHYSSPEELARRGDSIIHELITCLGPRIQRIFVHEEASRIH